MLTLVGIIAIVVFTIQVYKTATGTERNGVVWAAITVAIGIGLQFVVPIFIGIILAIYYIATGTPVESIESEIYGAALAIGIIGLVLSIVGMVLVMKFVSRVKDDEPAARTPPPPPPSFGENLQ